MSKHQQHRFAVQTFVLEPRAICAGLDELGLDRSDAAELIAKTCTRALQLRFLDRDNLAALEEAAAACRADLVINRATDGAAFSSEALIIAPEDQLQKLTDKLGKSGKKEAAALGASIARALNRYQDRHPRKLRLGETHLPLGERTLVMGILNVTPDSFSDGGRFDRLDQALEQAHRMAAEGADIIDIGGESTRPGHRRISVDEELKRVMPVIDALKKDLAFKLPLSIDTYKAAVAEKALDRGVEMLNDVWGLKEDKHLGRLAARYAVPICLMHNRNSTVYDNLVADILWELEESLALAKEAGIKDDNIIIDPGIGFGKTVEQNLVVMRNLDAFRNLGYPLLLGTSRKSMIGKTLNLPADERIEGTAATVACGIVAGADIVRVHDVKEMKRVALMTDALTRR